MNTNLIGAYNMDTNKEANITTSITVPNGTYVISPEVDRYVKQYKGFARQTAESIIKLGLTVVDAETSLSSVDFGFFCQESGLELNGSTYKKLKKIGEVANRFSPYADSLPNTWTTIYKLASLDSDKFDQLANGGVLSPFVSARKIDEFFGLPTEKSASNKTNKTEPKTDVLKNQVTISFETLNDVEKSMVAAFISDLSKRYKFSVTGANLNDFLLKAA